MKSSRTPAGERIQHAVDSLKPVERETEVMNNNSGKLASKGFLTVSFLQFKVELKRLAECYLIRVETGKIKNE